MKDLHIAFIERIINETGYDWDYVCNRFYKAIDQGVKPIDFFDNIVDEFCLGTTR